MGGTEGEGEERDANLDWLQWLCCSWDGKHLLSLSSASPSSVSSSPSLPLLSPSFPISPPLSLYLSLPPLSLSPKRLTCTNYIGLDGWVAEWVDQWIGG